MKEPTISITETKVKVAKRVPPGDRWSPLSNDSIILDSLTDALEYIYQSGGDTGFYMDARDGYVYVVKKTETVIAPEPEKRWSLYGEE